MDTSSNVPQATATEPQYKSVGGWLLLLCVVLTILSPLMTAITLVTAYKEATPAFEMFPGLRTIMGIDTVLSTIIMLFSIYAGISLWGIRPGAVRIAKTYLLCFLGYTLIAIVLPFMAGLPKEANDAMAAEVGKEVVRGFVFFGIWYSYLSRSQRVKGTYPEESSAVAF